MAKVSLYGVLDSISTMKDRTLKVVFRTNELNPIDAGILQSLVHDEGYCLFASEMVQDEDIPETTPEFKDQKTPSQRLRNTIYVYWEQSGKPGTFDEFYKKKMEVVIEFVKSKLE